MFEEIEAFLWQDGTFSSDVFCNSRSNETMQQVLTLIVSKTLLDTFLCEIRFECARTGAEARAGARAHKFAIKKKTRHCRLIAEAITAGRTGGLDCG